MARNANTHKTIQLMSLKPKGGQTADIHTIDLPPQLQKNLFALFEPKGEYANLMTSPLRQELRCWLDHTVSLHSVNRYYDGKDWIVALQPIDLERLCNLLSNYLICNLSKSKRENELFVPTMEMLEPKTFAPYYHERDVELFDDEGRPADDLSFALFSACAADALANKSIELPNGVSLRFSQVADISNKGWELVSNVQWYKDSPWAAVLQLHLETLPTKQQARLNLDILCRRYIGSAWGDSIHMKDNVNAHVRTTDGTLRVVPYGGRNNTVAWDELARRNFESCSPIRLPAIEDYLANMTTFAEEGHTPQILSPYSLNAGWASRPAVGSGIPIPDKSMLFEAVAALLKDLGEPTEPLEGINSTRLNAKFPDATEKLEERDPEQAKQLHSKYVRSNRKRLPVCTGLHELTIEILGTSADREASALVHSEIDYFLGELEEYENVVVRVEEIQADALLGPLDTEDEQKATARRDCIARRVGMAKRPTACIVLLPGPQEFNDKGDPKQAIRFGLALTGRLSQFLIPQDPDDNLKLRARAAVRDLMRQLGFIPEAKIVSEFENVPAWGICLYRAPRGKGKLQLPLAVRVDPIAGQVEAECPLFEGKRLPYAQALLELARISIDGSDDGPLKSINIDGAWPKEMVDKIKAEATSDTLLLVHAYSCMRWGEWWPGISDKSLGSGEFSYGPAKRFGKPVTPKPFELGDSRLKILRVRNGSHGEVPDYYTDIKSVDDDGTRVHSNRQGIFPAQGYVLGLAERTGDPDYYRSYGDSKFDHPGHRYVEKTLNEYFLLTPGDMVETMRWARYAEALRGLMVELVNTSMRVNQPAPLHFAELMGEYIWSYARP